MTMSRQQWKQEMQGFWRNVFYVSFALILLVVIWDTNRTNAAINGASIPEESIRLRILANSDSAVDQWVKREVRDAVMQEMASWAVESQSLENARLTITANLRRLEQVVGLTLQAYGADYPFKVELGNVPFPSKVYNGKVYPAQDYEALRITLGGGDGENWWCVLFPPLCFVDVVSAQKAGVDVDEEEGVYTDKPVAVETKTGTETEYRSFVWDWVKSIF